MKAIGTPVTDIKRTLSFLVGFVNRHELTLSMLKKRCGEMPHLTLTNLLVLIC